MESEEEYLEIINITNFLMENNSATVLPPISKYYRNLTTFVTLSLIASTLLFLLSLTIYFFSIKRIRKRLRADLRFPTIFLMSLYPIISAAAMATIFIPQAWLICHTIMHLSFTLGAIAFYHLLFRYANGEHNVIKEAQQDTMSIRTPPCCCCLFFISNTAPTRLRICIFRYLIFQMPIMQTGIMMTLNVFYYNEQEFYETVFRYFAPFLVCSILLGVWGLNVIINLIQNYVAGEHNIKMKFACLQLILILCKLQYILLDANLDSLDFGGSYPINNNVYKKIIINLLILVEMIPLSLFVQNAYQKPTQI